MGEVRVHREGKLSAEWIRKHFVNLDSIMSHAYGVKDAPLLNDNDIKRAFDKGIFVTKPGCQVHIYVTAEAFMDFPKLLRYAEYCGGREIGVVKIILPEELTKSYSEPVANGAQLKFQSMMGSHEAESLAFSPSVFKIQSISESSKDAYHFRKTMDKNKSEATKKDSNTASNQKSNIAPAVMVACMNTHADKERREALGCVDLKMGKFEGNLLLKSKHKSRLDPHFFVSTDGGTIFPLAVEGYGAHSITYLHAGEDRVWYVVKPCDFGRLESHVWENDRRKKLASEDPQCSQFVRHESIYVGPEYLAVGADFTRVVQKPGEMIIIFPFAYHQGFNIGANIAETQIYGDEHWANIFAQNPNWYLPCGQLCKGKGLWKPETISLKFLGKPVPYTYRGPSQVEDGDGKGFVFAPGGPIDVYRMDEFTQFGTSRIPLSQPEKTHAAVNESSGDTEPTEVFSPLFVGSDEDTVVAEE